jgi:hypothetical protein
LAFNVARQDTPSSAFVPGTLPSGSAVQAASILKRPPQQLTKKSFEHRLGHLDRPEVRDAFRRTWETAKNKADTMLNAAASEDYIELQNAGSDLGHTLQDMWELRSGRNDEWVGVLNFLQGILKTYELESLNVDQIQAIRTVVGDYLGPGTVNKDDVRRCLQVLTEGGIDPWRPISVNSKDTDND